MDCYKLPIDGVPMRISMEKEGAHKASYYLCGEISLGDCKLKCPQQKMDIRIPISSSLYESLEAELEVKGSDARIFVSGGLELTVKVPCIN